MINYFRRKWHGDMKKETNQIEALQATIFSFIQNEYLQRMNIDIASSNKYRYFKKVHSLLQLYSVNESNGSLCRLGNEYDGGYILMSPFSSKKIAYSIGISNDVSLDNDLAREGYDIYQYDHTIKKLPSVNNKFHWKKIGLSSVDKDNMQRLITMMRENGHDNTEGMLLKIDIEGAEWDVLSALQENELRLFDQIVIELHGLLDQDIEEKVLRGIAVLTEYHYPIHIHANNFSYVEYCGDMMLPNVIEMTLIRKEDHILSKSYDCLPLKLDRPCNPRCPELQLGIWNIQE